MDSESLKNAVMAMIDKESDSLSQVGYLEFLDDLIDELTLRADCVRDEM